MVAICLTFLSHNDHWIWLSLNFYILFYHLNFPLSTLKKFLFSLSLNALFCCVGWSQAIVDMTPFATEKFVGQHRPQVTILGTFHFTNNVAHDYNERYTVNTLTTDKQRELEELLTKLAAYRPTKILVESDRSANDSLLNVNYQTYLTGTDELLKNTEIHQIAFRLGKRLGLPKIHASDASAEWFGAELDWDNFAEDQYLKERNQYEKSYRYNYDTAYAVEDSLKSVLSLLDYFRFINDPQMQLYNHQIYLTETVLSGAGDNYIGADAVTRWYRRNLRIFSNVLDIADFDQEERLLVLYGSSHIWTLKQFFTDSPDFEYVEVREVLR